MENANIIKLAGIPDGPKIFVPELGCEVGTFTKGPEEFASIRGKKSANPVPCLMWHIPLNMRGDFRPEDLGNFSEKKKYRTDEIGKVLCYGWKKDGERCTKRAQNRFSRCDIHGGRLHPLDKILRQPEQVKGQASQPLSRYKQFLAGEIGVDDLDDEELATCSFRASNGHLYKPKNIPREMAHAFTRAIFDRAQSEMRSHTVKAAQTMAEIMIDKNNDPEVRLKAAKELLERNLGRTPQVLAITAQSPWEEIFDGIAGGTREDSRRRRAITSKRLGADGDSEPGTVDAEIVDESNTDAANAQGDKGFAETGQTDRTQPDAVNNGNDRQSGASNQIGLSGNGGSRETSSGRGEFRESRLFDRNPAILAQTLEIPPDQTPEEIPTATTDFDSPPKERDVALRRQYIKVNGQRRIRHVLHIYDKEFQLGTEFVKEPETD